MPLHGGQQYRYQFLSALAYLLTHHFDWMSLEGMNFEDSIFYRGTQRVVIGESKTSSNNHWTARALFYSGNERGPLLQLWERWSGNEELILFSSISLESSIDRDGWIDIPDDKLIDIIENIQNKVSNGRFSLRDSSNFDLATLKLFLSKTEFEYYQVEIIEDIVKRVGSSIGNITTEGIDRFLGYVNSSVYQSGDRIPLDQIKLLLLGEESNIDTENMIENIRGQIRTRIYDAFSAFDWEVEFDYNRSILTNLGTMDSTERIFECLASRNGLVAGNSERILIDAIVPIRTVISPSSRGQPLVFRILPPTNPIQLTSRLLPLQGLNLSSAQMVHEFQNLFIEKSHRQSIPLSQIVQGDATSRFNEKLRELHDDYVFFFDNLQHERENTVYMGRVLTGKNFQNSHRNYILCPVLIIDGEIVTEEVNGHQNHVNHLIFRNQEKFYHVIDAMSTEHLADTLTNELNGIITWISKKF